MCNFTENLSYVEAKSDKRDASITVCLAIVQNYVAVLSPASTTTLKTGFNSARFLLCTVCVP